MSSIATTVIFYRYTTASDQGKSGQLSLDGAITAAQRERLEAALNLGRFFIPEQIGVDPIYAWLVREADPDDDHCWHDIEDIQVVEVRDQRGGPVGRTVEQFVRSVERAAQEGWQTFNPGIEEAEAEA